MRAGEQLAVALRRAARGCRACAIEVGDARGIGALAFEHVRLGRPALSARVAAIGRFDQRDDRVDIVGVALRNATCRQSAAVVMRFLS